MSGEKVYLPVLGTYLDVGHQRMPDCDDSKRIDDLSLVAGRYRTIYADPPWSYGDKACGGGVGAQYATETIESLCDKKRFPVNELACQDGAHLWMWTTWPMIREMAPHRLLEAWGFRWVGEIVWEKPGLGVGRWLRPATEVLTLAVKGKLKLLRYNVRAFLQHKRLGHSVKPDAFAKLIETISPGPRIELFARVARPGWDRWGNQA